MNTAIKLLTKILKPWPRSVVRFIGKPLGFLWWDLFGIRKKVVLENLTKAFPDWSEDKKKLVGRKSVYMLMENFFEMFLIPSIDEKWIENNIVFHGLEKLDQALLEKKGVLLLSLHLGNGDLMANCLTRKAYKVAIITKFFKSKILNSIWFSVRGAQGVEHIPPHGDKTPFMILKFLKNNGCVGFVLDQHMGKPYGIKTRFFGHVAGTAYGLALFHIKTKSPVVPVYNYQGDDGKTHIVIDFPFYYQSGLDTQDREQTLVELTQRYTDKIEEVVRRYPDQWMWVHRRWKWKGN